MSKETFPVAYFFHASDTLVKRKKMYNSYSEKFDTQLFMLESSQSTPKIMHLEHSDESYQKADGLFVGESLSK